MQNPFSRKKAPAAPKRESQIKTAYNLTKTIDPKIGLWIAVAFIAPIIAAAILAFTIGPWYIWLVIGFLLGAILATVTFTRRAQKAMFSSVAGQQGAAGAALSTLRAGWSSEQEPVAIDPRTYDMVFRAVGRAGVVLVTEGPTTRVKKLVDSERKRLNRVVPNVPVHVINTGDQEGQVELRKVSSTIQRMKPVMSKEEVNTVKNKLRSLGAMRPAMPKGMDPGLMKVSQRRMRRG